MSRIPDARWQMRRANYGFLGNSECKFCGGPIEWWKTTNGYKVPFNPPQTQQPETEPAERHDCRADRPAAKPAPASICSQRR
jgi:hypothetical protein